MKQITLSRPDECHHAWRNNKIWIVCRRRANIDVEASLGSKSDIMFEAVTAFHDEDFARLYVTKMNKVPDIYERLDIWSYSMCEVPIESR